MDSPEGQGASAAAAETDAGGADVGVDVDVGVGVVVVVVVVVHGDVAATEKVAGARHQTGAAAQTQDPPLHGKGITGFFYRVFLDISSRTTRRCTEAETQSTHSPVVMYVLIHFKLIET